MRAFYRGAASGSSSKTAQICRRYVVRLCLQNRTNRSVRFAAFTLAKSPMTRCFRARRMSRAEPDRSSSHLRKNGMAHRNGFRYACSSERFLCSRPAPRACRRAESRPAAIVIWILRAVIEDRLTQVVDALGDHHSLRSQSRPNARTFFSSTLSKSAFQIESGNDSLEKISSTYGR
jgi:hypothetical protein